MTFRRVTVALALSSVCIWSVPAVERDMAVADIKPGMVGVGRTAFIGNTLEDFKAHILGVLKNTNAPSRDLILARLEGGPLARTGVIAGMSGSPVYIDGRLIGAVAYQLGSFPTEAIAGITPIAEMRDASRLSSPRPPASPVKIPAHITPETFWHTMRAFPARFAPFPAQSAVVQALQPGIIDPARLSALRPIAVPLTFGGIGPDAAAPLIDMLGHAGFVTTPAAGGSSQAPSGVRLRPGDPVGAMLARGDYDIGATGTVTDVDGDTVYAFGHPLFGLGPTRVPMTTAYVHTILPSLMSSIKVASTGQVIGSFTQDRATVLAGTLGPGPDMIPLTIGLTGADGRRRDVRLSIVDDQFFTPLLAFVAVGNALSTFERDLGVNTYAVRGTLSVRGHAPVTFEDVFTGDGAASDVAATVSVPLAALETNDREPARIDAVTLDVTTVERARVSTIERVWIDTPDVRAGRPLTIKVLLKPYRGADEVRTIVADIPIWVQGPLTIVVADGPRLAQYEQRDGRTPMAGGSVAQILSQVRQVKRNNRLYVRVYGRNSGAMVAGEPLPALPNSVLAVIEGDRAASGNSSLTSALVGSWDVPVDFAVSGLRALSVTPVPPGRLP